MSKVPARELRKGKPARIDHGQLRQVYERNRKRIFATQSVCAICGQPVDFSLKYPDPMSATCDHIIPIALGGDPIALDNLQLAHAACNMKKSSKLMEKRTVGETDSILSNRLLPQSMDWFNY